MAGSGSPTNEVRGDYSIADEESPSIAVVRAVAQSEGVDPATLDQQLNEVVDPDALDALFAPRGDGRSRQGGQVSFVFNGYVVTLNNSETVQVEPLHVD